MVSAGAGGGKVGRKGWLVLEVNMNTPVYLKWVTNKDLVYSTRELCSKLWQPGREGSLGGMDMCAVWLSHSAIHQKLSPQC